MIHAQVDVELRDHERITGADLSDVPEEWQAMTRAAMLGLFTWCLLYGQAKRSELGEIPMGSVHGALCGGQEATARRLVTAGLLKASGSVYVIRNYAMKNRTRADIDASIAATAERVSRFRQKKAGNSNAVGNASVTRYKRVTAGSGSGSGSSSSSDSLSFVSEGVQGEVGPVAAFVEAAKPVPPAPASKPRPVSTHPPASLSEPGAVEAWAERWKLPADDPEFGRFLDYHRAKGNAFRDWGAAWRNWKRNEGKFAAQSSTRLVQGIPASGRAWKLPEGL